jgi:hypothetical protein
MFTGTRISMVFRYDGKKEWRREMTIIAMPLISAGHS